ncbi:MAG: hypothetical protein AAFV07_14455, partial [Bacteroidota bacterium]
MRKARWMLVLCLLFGCFQVAGQQMDGPDFSIETIFNLAREKYLSADLELDVEAGFPRNALPHGEWRQTPADDWTSGFFPGTLWYIYEATHDWRVKDAAVKWTEALEEIQYMHHHHDIGFMMYCSYGNALRLINNPAYEPILLQSARTLAARYNP